MSISYETLKSLPPHPSGPPYISGGSPFSQALFAERVVLGAMIIPTYRPPFTLMVQREGYICGRTSFVACGDPTGYQWAIKYLGDYQHFKLLMTKAWFREAYQEWISELNIKQKAEAIERIRTVAEGDSIQAFQANKFIAMDEANKSSSRGRPSKLDIAAELKRETDKLTVTDEDMIRIGLKVIEGGKRG